MNVFDIESSIRSKFKYLGKPHPDDREFPLMLKEADIEVFNAAGGITHPIYGKNSLISVQAAIDTTTNYIRLYSTYGRVLLDRVAIYRTGVSTDWELVPIYEEGYIVPVGLTPTEQIYGLFSGNKITFPNIAYMDNGTTSVLVRIQYEAPFARLEYLDSLVVKLDSATSTVSTYTVILPSAFKFKYDMIGGVLRRMISASTAIDEEVLTSPAGAAVFTTLLSTETITVDNPNYAANILGATWFRSKLTKISVSQNYKLAMVDFVMWRYGGDPEAKEGFMRKVQKELTIGSWENRSGISLSSAFDNNYLVSDYQ